MIVVESSASGTMDGDDGAGRTVVLRMPGGVGFYRSAAGRERYLAAYDRLAGFGRPPSDVLDVPTGFGVVRVYRHGPERGVPLVMLPGMMGTSASLAASVAGLAGAEFPVYSLDVLGQPGHSVQTLPVRTAADCVRWLGDVLAVIAPTAPAHLVGVSYGAWLAWTLALGAPERVASVTLVEPAGNVLARTSPRLVLGALSQAPGMPEAVRTRFHRWVLGGRSEEPLMHAVYELMAEGTRHYHPTLVLPNYSTDQVMRSVRPPVLALLGGRSVIHDVAVARRRADELIPDAEVRLWPTGTHALPVEFADDVNARILDFVRRRAPRPTP